MIVLNAMLAATLAVGAVSPAKAPSDAATRQDALVTVVRPLTPTVQDDRQAAVTYMDDSLSLLQLAYKHLTNGQRSLARAELMSASGKLSTAQLILYKDHRFTRALAPLSIRAEQVYQAASGDTEHTRALVSALQHDLRPLYREQVANLGGGGAGKALEDLDQLRR